MIENGTMQYGHGVRQVNVMPRKQPGDGGRPLSVIVIPCATAISNRMYTLQEGAGRRLHDTSHLLEGIYREIDFDRAWPIMTLLDLLHRTDPDRFGLVEREIKHAWLVHMQTLLRTATGTRVLVWSSDRRPSDEGDATRAPSQRIQPVFVDEAMIAAIRGLADRYVEGILDGACLGSLTVRPAVAAASSAKPDQGNF